MRKATISRQTKETDISLELNLDGTGKAEINT
ncbi:MAG: imidazoleglycerol-phosphate dehydratase, partial [Methanosarcinaceae archaeon]|nr:imidazoleglycerol-phosphate dehydratase [Methanosarcinaceae archaeon]